MVLTIIRDLVFLNAQEWKDTLLDISLYAIFIYTAEWFIELFTIGTQVSQLYFSVTFSIGAGQK